MLNRFKGLAASLCLGAMAAASPALAADYYQGKRLTVLINFAAGGPTDIEGRLFARHVVRHLPGASGVVIQNMDGGGGGNGVNFLGEVAPKDGTVIGYLTGAAWRYVTVKEKSSRVDFLSYNMVAYQPGTTVYYARSNVEPGLKTATDLIKAKNIVVGGLTADSSKDLLERLTLDLLGVKHKYVTGYTSNANARLALQRNEINMFAESPPGYISVIAPGLVASGEAIPLFYDPGWNGVRFSTPAQAKGLDMKPFQEFYREAMGRDPEGQLWKTYKQSLAINAAMQRLVAFPPGTPKPAIEAMRDAIRKMGADPEYAADAMKTVGFVPDYEAGENVQSEVVNALTIPEEDRTFIADYIARGQIK